MLVAILLCKGKAWAGHSNCWLGGWLPDGPVVGSPLARTWQLLGSGLDWAEKWWFAGGWLCPRLLLSVRAGAMEPRRMLRVDWASAWKAAVPFVLAPLLAVPVYRTSLSCSTGGLRQAARYLHCTGSSQSASLFPFHFRTWPDATPEEVNRNST